MKELAVGVVSDTHHPDDGFSVPWEAIKLHLHDVDVILHAGDIVTREALDLLSAIAPVEAVSGNMDDAGLSATLPEKKILALNAVTIALIHRFDLMGDPANRLRYCFKNQKIDILVFGHTHKALNQTIGTTLFFNPGSPVKPAYPTSPSIGKIHISPDRKVKSAIIFL